METTQSPPADFSTLKPVSDEYIAQKMAEKASQATTEKVVEKTVKTEEPKANVTNPEPKTEVKAEEPKTDEVKTEATDEPKRKKFKDIAKPFSKEKKEIVEVKDDDIPAPLKEKIAKYEAQLAEYEKLKKDPDWEILKAAKESDKDIFDLLREVEGTDVNKLTPVELYEMDLKSKGIDGEDLEEALADFNELKAYEQKAKTNDLRDRLKKDKNAVKSDFLSKLKANAGEANQDRAKQMAAIQKTNQEFDALCDAYVGNEHMAVVGTPQMAESLKNVIKDGLIRKNEDGSFNAQDLFEFAHFKLFKDLMLENLENQAYSQGFEDLKKDVEVTKGASIKTVRSPQAKQVTGKEAFEYTMANARAVN